MPSPGRTTEQLLVDVDLGARELERKPPLEKALLIYEDSLGALSELRTRLAQKMTIQVISADGTLEDFGEATSRR